MNESALSVILELGPKYGVDLWKHVQWYAKATNEWVDCRGDEYLSLHRQGEYRVKPRTHIVNGIECPAPMSERPEYNDFYWYIDTAYPNPEADTWVNDDCDEYRFELGIFKTEDDMKANFYAHYPHMRPEAE